MPPILDINQQTGYFVLSFDTELALGHFDCFDPRKFSPDGQRERWAIERILDALDEFEITATWAIVGHLFHASYNTSAIYPMPNWIEPGSTFEQMYTSSHPLLYGQDVIDLLLTRGDRHEIGFHGYTHKLFNVMSEADVRAEIETWRQVSRQREIIPEVVIFPRNRTGHLEVFREYGFTCYRGEEFMPWMYFLPLIGKVFRRLYYEVSPFFTPPVYDVGIDESGLVNIPSSRWLFGFNPHIEAVLEALKLHTLRLRKLVQGVKRAAAEKRVLHLWAHPYEFRTEKDIDKLRYVLWHVAEAIHRGQMQSVGMVELARLVTGQGAGNRRREEVDRRLWNSI